MENNTDDLYRQTVEKVKEDVEKQLPILEQNLTSLCRAKNIVMLPICIHNICIIFEREAYKYLDPALRLYQSMNNASLPEDLRKMSHETLHILEDLSDKERKLFHEQYAEMLAYKKRAKKEGLEYDRRAEIASFNHLEADLSSFYKKLIMLNISGVYTLTHKQLKIFDEAYWMTIKSLKRLIPQKRQTLKNCNRILGLES